MMIRLKLSEAELAAKSALFRYIYYVVSSCSFTGFSSWRAMGEPNPFVNRTYKPKVTERVDFTNIFDDVLGPRSRVSRQGLD